MSTLRMSPCCCWILGLQHGGPIEKVKMSGDIVGPIMKGNVNTMQVLYHQMSFSINIYHQPLSKNTKGHLDCKWGPTQGLQTCRCHIGMSLTIGMYIAIAVQVCMRERVGRSK